MGRSKDIAPIYHAAAVTKSDTATFSTTRNVYVGVTGDVTVTMATGSIVTFPNVPVGTHLWQVNQIRSTGTTASGFVLGY